MRVSRANLISAGLVAAAFVATAALYRRLPDRVPVHWDVHGRVNGFMSKPWGALVLPLTMLGVWLLLLLLPRISPHGYRLERFPRAFETIQLSILSFLLFGTVLVLLAGAGVPVPIVRALTAGIGVLFLVLGNVLGKVTKNFFVGIRTPWTLASDEVWLRTQRLGGRVFVVAGLVIAASGLLGAGPTPLLATIGVAALIPVVYSYVIYRRLEGPTGRAR